MADGSCPLCFKNATDRILKIGFMSISVHPTRAVQFRRVCIPAGLNGLRLPSVHSNWEERLSIATFDICHKNQQPSTTDQGPA